MLRVMVVVGLLVLVLACTAYAKRWVQSQAHIDKQWSDVRLDMPTIKAIANVYGLQGNILSYHWQMKDKELLLHVSIKHSEQLVRDYVLSVGHLDKRPVLNTNN